MQLPSSPGAGTPIRKTIAMLPGDGIGREVLDAAEHVLRSLPELDFTYTEHPCGAGEYLRAGNPLPPSTLDACRSADATLLGAMGLPDVRWPDGREMAPQLDIREQLELFAGVRPVKLYNPAHSPLRKPSIDFILIRESTEGLFSTRLRPRQQLAAEVCDELRVSRTGAERLFRFSFRLARTRDKRLTLIDKANVLPSMAFFREIFYEIAAEYPDVEPSHVYVDAAALYMVQSPERFDVCVTENMFGDILSDLAAGTIGGMGLAPSADIGNEHAVFQPAHGSAPDIAGKGIANPVATIISAAMMLEWFGEPACQAAATRLRNAVERVLGDPANATPDVGGRLTTPELTARIVEAL
ncbi:MAG: isocitrate/isopropylmalate dehydrogenase family protein [Bryobacteraceae bacterium]|nr:isocitrate/isopropylmalate dehydrogenase family protein [Bryobacteraceae bacterium]